MKTVEHIEVLVETEIYQTTDPAQGIKDALDRLRGEHGAQVYSSFVENGTAYTPTLSAYWNFVCTQETAEARAQGEALFRMFIELTGQLHHSGVKLLAGTDNRPVPGKGLHEELAFLIQAGLSPLEALQAATSLPAQVMGVHEQVGTIEVGKQADLVLLMKDPLKDIRNAQTIASVVLRGRFLDQEVLTKMRAAAQ